MNYAEGIRTLRKRMLLTQVEFANSLGVAFISINRWENGHCEPTMKAKRKKSHYKRLNDYFDVYYKLRRLIQYEANLR